MQHGSGINPKILQSYLDSATNALAKGQSQFFTPLALARSVCNPLPQFRRTICDLTCGAGHFLHGARNRTTRHLLGADIDPCEKTTLSNISRIAADLTLLYPLLVEIDWMCDLFVLNPPWDLHWDKERLSPLADSSLHTVADSITETDPRVGRDRIDSTIATLMIALDRGTYRSEGVLLANHATIQRLIFAPNAPYQKLAEHVWARWKFDGNPITGRMDHAYSRRRLITDPPSPRGEGQGEGPTIQIEALYFARSPYHTAERHCTTTEPARTGYHAAISDESQAHEPSWRDWTGVIEEWKARTNVEPPKFHLSLTDTGAIRTYLSIFEDRCGKIDRAKIKRLHEIQGFRPLQLIHRRETRKLLFENLQHWRVDPALRAAVDAAMAEYNAIRAPLYPLPTVQRLGYLEEEDFIRCIKDFGWRDSFTSSDRAPVFLAGQSYQLATRTLEVTREAKRMNLHGQQETFELTGQELGIFVRSGEFEVCFMRWPDIDCDGVHCPKATLETLLEHFQIPDVPDVATVHPDQYTRNLQELSKIETLLA